MKKVLVVFVLLLIGVLVVFVAIPRLSTQNNGTNPPEVPEPSGSASTASVPVDAVLAEQSDLTQHIETSGTVNALRKVDLVAQVTGYVQSVPVENGEIVAEGAVLVQVEEEPIRLELERNRSAFLRTLAEVVQEMEMNDTPHAGQLRSYYQSAFRQNSLPVFPGIQSSPTVNPEAFTEAEYLMLARQDIPGLYAQVKQSEEDLSHCSLRAPFSGIVSGLQVSEGTYLREGSRLLELINLDRVELEIDILEEDLVYVHQGSMVELLDGSGAVISETVISGVGPTIDPNTRTGKVYAVMENGDHQLKDGQFIRVRLEKQTFPDRLIVPREAILTRNDRDLVFVVEDGLAKWRYIEQGVENDQYVEILSGVEPGETVVVGGHYSLAHDANVDVRLR